VFYLFIKEVNSRQKEQLMKAELNIGSPAPDFTLRSKPVGGDVQMVKLSENFGKRPTVLFFVPLAFTPVCTKTFCAVSKENHWDEFRKMGAAVYGISVDSPFTLEAWAKDQGITFPLLSDFNREVAPQYGVLAEDFKGFQQVCWRSVFVINSQGKIAHMWKAPAEDGNQYPDMDGVRKALEEEMAATA